MCFEQKYSMQSALLKKNIAIICKIIIVSLCIEFSYVYSKNINFWKQTLTYGVFPSYEIHNFGKKNGLKTMKMV